MHSRSKHQRIDLRPEAALMNTPRLGERILTPRIWRTPISPSGEAGRPRSSSAWLVAGVAQVAAPSRSIAGSPRRIGGGGPLQGLISAAGKAAPWPARRRRLATCRSDSWPGPHVVRPKACRHWLQIGPLAVDFTAVRRVSAQIPPRRRAAALHVMAARTVVAEQFLTKPSWSFPRRRGGWLHGARWSLRPWTQHDGCRYCRQRSREAHRDRVLNGRPWMRPQRRAPSPPATGVELCSDTWRPRKSRPTFLAPFRTCGP